ncbi:hypothetical protein [Aureimonas sp. AU22]|uniref:hypothetical protein n=1 Tax=Aureimonas sp. AU22 TaxID=1638162 RepID=UPI000784051E|nr:hypothetical protein [Aureimonas sp. AU22]
MASGIGRARRLYRDCLRQCLAERICVHCGMAAETDDPNVPDSLFGFLYAIQRPGSGGVTVPVCRECASASKDIRFATPEAQRRHIDAVLRARHRRDLAVADWEDDEVARLGYVLRTAVLNGIDGRERAEARLAWPRRRPKGE